MPLDALLLDVDGTLVDTNPIHVKAFAKAFAQFGFKVEPSRIEPEIGKGGDHLIGAVLGAHVEEEQGEAIRKALTPITLEMMAAQKVATLPGAVQIIEIAHQNGLKVAVATSGELEMFEAIEKSCGVKFSEIVDLVITSKDAKESKPSPDILSAATQKLGLTPAQCALVGDTIHDARAARAAGIACFGVLTGTHAEADLREAGARKSYRDVGDIAANFEEFLQLASPLQVRLDQNALENLMREALECAREGMAADEVPVGSVLANGAGEIIGRGFNRINATRNLTAHAEMQAFADAAGRAPLDARDLILVSTLEPCVMCAGAAMETGIDTVIFGLEAPFDGGTHRISAPRSPNSSVPRFIGHVLEAEIRELLEAWLGKNRGAGQAVFVAQLLSG